MFITKAIDIGKLSASGGLHLFFGQSISTIIMAAGTIILARLLTPSEYGLYSIAIVPSLTFALFHDWGINNALIKFIATYISLGKSEKIPDVVASGLLFKAISGLFLSFISFCFSNFIATFFFNRPEIGYLISLSSFSILSDSILTATQSSFTGFEKMKYKSYSMISLAILKSTITPLLALLGYGAIGAVIGYSLSYLISAFLSLFLIYYLIIKKFNKFSLLNNNLIKSLKKMFSYGLPISLSAILSNLLSRFYMFLAIYYSTDVLIGNFQVASNFALLLTFLTIPISTVLFPAFSKLHPKQEFLLVNKIYASSVKYSSLLLVPTVMIIIILAEPMIQLIYGQQYINAPFFLMLSVIQYLLIVFGNLVMQSFFIGVGETKIILKLSLINVIFGVPLSLFLIPSYGITGQILCFLFANIPPVLIGVFWLWKKYGYKPSFKISAKIFIASAISAILTHLFIKIFLIEGLLSLIGGLSMYLIVYTILILSLDGINQEDITTLKKIFSGFGVLSKVIIFTLNFASFLLNFKNNKK